MTGKFIDLVAYIDGQEVKWSLNPSPKTLYAEAHEFAGSICELCKTIIRNQIASNQRKNSTISVIITCEGFDISCKDYAYNTNDYQMSNSSFERKMFGYKLSIAESVVVSVVSTDKFENQFGG